MLWLYTRVEKNTAHHSEYIFSMMKVMAAMYCGDAFPVEVTRKLSQQEIMENLIKINTGQQDLRPGFRCHLQLDKESKHTAKTKIKLYTSKYIQDLE